MPEEVKEVVMDVSHTEGKSRRRKTRKRHTAESVIEKDTAVELVAPAPAPAPKPVKTKPTVLVLAPARKKAARVMLVPKGKEPKPSNTRKTFKAKQVHVIIDNTAKTHKRRKQLLNDIDNMTDQQVRDASVAAKLARKEKVAKVPVGILRQTLKDYKMMRGLLL
jgi:hypothetical protein